MHDDNFISNFIAPNVKYVVGLSNGGLRYANPPTGFIVSRREFQYAPQRCIGAKAEAASTARSSAPKYRLLGRYVAVNVNDEK